MKKILTISEGVKLAQKFKKQNKTIVVVGGVFDILHLGHIKFLENAKKQGDYLFVLLEDDKKAKTTKGPKRPINSQKDRAKILSALESVDYIILLKNMTNNDQYDKLISQMSPSVFAVTENDPQIIHKKRQAKLVKGKIMFVTKRINDYSTTQLAKNL